MKLEDEDRLGIHWQTGPDLHIKTQVYTDFSARTLFVGFYIPESPHTYAACLALADAVPSTIETMQKHLGITASYRDEATDFKELVFSGRVFLYHETRLTIVQKAAIINRYAAQHFDVQFRGPDYLADQVIAWHRQHDSAAAR